MSVWVSVVPQDSGCRDRDKSSGDLPGSRGRTVVCWGPPTPLKTFPDNPKTKDYSGHTSTVLNLLGTQGEVYGGVNSVSWSQGHLSRGRSSSEIFAWHEIRALRSRGSGWLSTGVLTRVAPGTPVYS